MSEHDAIVLGAGPGGYLAAAGKKVLLVEQGHLGGTCLNVPAGGDDRMRYDAIPWVVYGMPEAAGVGLTEQEALARGIEVAKASFPLRAVGRFAAENGFSAPFAAKLVADAATGRVLGVHVGGAYASEMIWGAAVLVEQELPIADLKQIVFPHPAVCEAIREAAWEVG